MILKELGRYSLGVNWRCIDATSYKGSISRERRCSGRACQWQANSGEGSQQGNQLAGSVRHRTICWQHQLHNPRADSIDWASGHHGTVGWQCQLNCNRSSGAASQAGRASGYHRTGKQKADSVSSIATGPVELNHSGHHRTGRQEADSVSSSVAGPVTSWEGQWPPKQGRCLAGRSFAV